MEGPTAGLRLVLINFLARLVARGGLYRVDGERYREVMTKLPDASKGAERDVYKAGATARRAHWTTRGITDLMVGTSNAVADGARAFSDTVRTRAGSGAARPLDLMEASSLMTSKVLEAMAKSWR